MNKTIILIACGLAAACTSEPKTEEKKTDSGIPLSREKMGIMDITLTTPVRNNLNSYIYLNGKVTALPNLQASVFSKVNGVIDNILVSEGDYVRKGQALMVLSSMELIEMQNEYLSVVSDKNFLEIEYQRQEELQRNKIGALAEFQITEAKFYAASSKEKALQAKLNLLGIDMVKLKDPRNFELTSSMVITSPISGYLFALNGTIGMMANREIELAEIINLDELRAELYLYDKDLDAVQEGQTVELDFINKSIPSIKGKVSHISRALEAGNKAITVYVNFKSPGERLVLPSMNVRGKIIEVISSGDKFVVPYSAILPDGDYFYVFGCVDSVGSNNLIFKKIKVALGTRNDTQTEIKFLSPVPYKMPIAEKNVMILEMERKKFL